MLLCCVLCEWMLLWKATTLFISLKSLDGSFEAINEVQKALKKKENMYLEGCFLVGLQML